jgi:cell division protease FtsH
VAGLEKRNRLLNPREREIVACHEMGHALVALSLPGSDAVHKVSIIPRGVGALGYTIQRPTEDRFLMTREELDAQDHGAAGRPGRRTPDVRQPPPVRPTTLAKVTDIARDMVTRHGMSEALGHVAYEPPPPRFPDLPLPPRDGWTPSPDTQRQVDEAVRGIVMDAFERTMAVLVQRRELLSRCARELLARETLHEATLRSLLASPAARRGLPQRGEHDSPPADRPDR